MQDQIEQEEHTIPEMVDDVSAGKMDRRTLIKRLALMGLSAVGAGTIAEIAARRIAAHAAPTVPGDNNGHLHIQRHNDHLIHQAAGNIQQVQQDYHENAIVVDSMYPYPLVGHQAIMNRKSAGFAAMPDLKITVTKRIVRGDQLTVEWVASGTHQVEYPGLPAIGRRFSIPGVTVVVRRNGKILREYLLCWLLGTSVLIFSVLRLIERAFLSKHAAEKYNQYGLESIDFLLFCLF